MKPLRGIRRPRKLVRLAVVLACVLIAAWLVGAEALEAGSWPRRARVVINNGLDANGSFVVGGKPTFLIAVGNPPPLSGTTPAGVRGLLEIAHAGVNLVRVGPAWTGWTRGEVEKVLGWERAATRFGLHTWVRLNAFAATQPRWPGDARLAATVHALTRSRFAAGIGLWQGADEPWSRGIPAHSLAFFYCRVSSRIHRRACAGEPTLDRHHPLVTILAPTGNRAALARYGDVTDSLGVDVYPVTLSDGGAPDLHLVGVWTRRIGRLTRTGSVWTTLQICAVHAYDRQTGAYVLPTPYQERYMVYDAIINGARGISFFGGDNPHCWNAVDRRLGWNWSFWNSALERLVEQIGAHSALDPALDNAASNEVLATSDPGTEAISRIARYPRRLWVLAARSTGRVGQAAIYGLPPSARSAAVYGEHRTVPVTHGTIRDTFRQWQVHVYRIELGASPRH